MKRWFNWTADGRYEEHWVVDRDGKDRRPIDRDAARACFDVEPQDLLLSAYRTRAGARKAYHLLPPQPTAAQMTRVMEHMDLYGART
jgi:hypothetical protein